jgi:hypothetical protein
MSYDSPILIGVNGYKTTSNGCSAADRAFKRTATGGEVFSREKMRHTSALNPPAEAELLSACVFLTESPSIVFTSLSLLVSSQTCSPEISSFVFFAFGQLNHYGIVTVAGITLNANTTALQMFYGYHGERK